MLRNEPNELDSILPPMCQRKFHVIQFSCEYGGSRTRTAQQKAECHGDTKRQRKRHKFTSGSPNQVVVEVQPPVTVDDAALVSFFIHVF